MCSERLPCAVITVVDALHIIQHLDETKPEGVENESVEQIAFADRILLNKIDLVSEERLKEIENRILAINGGVQIMRTQLKPSSDQEISIDLDKILNVDAFNLQKILESEPDFLSESSHEHIHDKSVGSVGFRFIGELNIGKMQEWIRTMMTSKGNDLYRYKVNLEMLYGRTYALTVNKYYLDWQHESREVWEPSFHHLQLTHTVTDDTDV